MIRIIFNFPILSLIFGTATNKNNLINQILKTEQIINTTHKKSFNTN